jgi:hypothetical protein
VPPYSPGLDPQEHIWEELREKSLYSRAFGILGLLEDDLAGSLKILETQHDTTKGSGV